MRRVLLQYFKSPLKAASVDLDATEGAVIGENLWIRQTDGSLALFEPSSGVVTPAVGNAVVVTVTSAGAVGAPASVGGSNSGYQQDISPAAAPTNYDLDASMIAGLGDLQFPIINHILVGNGAAWVSVPMIGDGTMTLTGGNSGKLNVSVVSKTATATNSGANVYVHQREY